MENNNRLGSMESTYSPGPGYASDEEENEEKKKKKQQLQHIIYNTWI